MKNRIIIIGSEGGAKNVIEILELDKKNKIVGLIDDYKTTKDFLFGYKILGKINDLPILIKKYKINSIFVAIGDNHNREIICEKMIEDYPDMNFVNAIHPSVHIGKNVIVGRGNFIMPGVSIGADCMIGNFINIYDNSTIGQTSSLCDYSSLSSGVNVGGYCLIGAGSFIGIGSVIKHKTKIERYCVIGAGSVVLKSIKSNSLAYGVPAKVIRKRKDDEPYL